MQSLSLGGNYIYWLGALDGLTNLTQLDVDGNLLANIDPLTNMVNLQTVDITDNTIYLAGGSPASNDLYTLTLLDPGVDIINIYQNPAPIINSQPTNLSLNGGDTAVFTVTATSTDSSQLYYQWYFSGNPVTDTLDGRISGSLSDTLTITNVEGADMGSYFAVVTDDTGSIYSDPAQLSVDVQVIFDNAALEAAVRAAIHIPSGAIFQSDLAGFTNLTLENQGIASVQGLNLATNLNKLNLDYNPITNASLLSGLTKLQELYLDNCGITNLDFLDGLTNIYYMEINGNLFTDLSPVTNLVANLTGLHMEDNQCTNIQVLAALTNLDDLDVHGNNITDLSFVSGLPVLFQLDVSQNLITNISSVTNLVGCLNWLYAGGNQIASAEVLQLMTNCYVLYLSGNPLTQVDFLAQMPQMAWLALDNTQVTDLAFLESLTNLYTLDLSYVPAVSVTPIYNLPNSWNIGNFYVRGLRLTNMTFATVMTNLVSTSFAVNDIADISPLSGASNLIYLSWQATGSAISQPLRGKPVSRPSPPPKTPLPTSPAFRV